MIYDAHAVVSHHFVVYSSTSPRDFWIIFGFHCVRPRYTSFLREGVRRYWHAEKNMRVPHTQNVMELQYEKILALSLSFSLSLMIHPGGNIWMGDLETGEGTVMELSAPGPAFGLDHDRRSGYLFVAGGPTGTCYFNDD